MKTSIILCELEIEFRTSVCRRVYAKDQYAVKDLLTLIYLYFLIYSSFYYGFYFRKQQLNWKVVIPLMWVNRMVVIIEKPMAIDCFVLFHEIKNLLSCNSKYKNSMKIYSCLVFLPSFLYYSLLLSEIIWVPVFQNLTEWTFIFYGVIV